jgi:hypothetical protein
MTGDWRRDRLRRYDARDALAMLVVFVFIAALAYVVVNS